MQQSNIKSSRHDWEKKNLVTLSKGNQHYDEMVCLNCGMKGKRFGFTEVEVSDRYKKENVECCPNAVKEQIPEKVKITHCNAQGGAFANLIPGSEHEVVIPPKGYKNDHTGVWVMGVGEPVKLLSNEFERMK